MFFLDRSRIFYSAFAASFLIPPHRLNDIASFCCGPGGHILNFMAVVNAGVLRASFCCHDTFDLALHIASIGSIQQITAMHIYDFL